MNVDGTIENINEVQKIVSPLLGMRPWSVRVTRNKFLIFNFGKRIIIKGEKLDTDITTGEWSLIVKCGWRLQTTHEVIAGWGDSKGFIDEKITCLTGKALESITISGPALETDIRFETELLLRLFPIYTDDKIHWHLFLPGYAMLAIGPETTWSYIC